ncbi:hypothetical protein ACH4VR_29475 [Streptomyces sp. NPDC020883]|uniref:hypothetical protein n=1 Tax=Streptomyces sp. NPDC020883 TaxID=3365099 RepID=UPI0037924E4A
MDITNSFTGGTAYAPVIQAGNITTPLTLSTHNTPAVDEKAPGVVELNPDEVQELVGLLDRLRRIDPASVEAATEWIQTLR